jgi:hypothetical protein
MAAALAVARIPAGFALPVDDPKEIRMPVRLPSPEPTVSVQQVIDRFLEKHPSYVLDHSDWAILIRPGARNTCSSALERVVANTPISDAAYVAFWKLARLVSPFDTPVAPPGVICGGNCDASERPAHNDRVVLPLNGVTLQDALSQVVSQAPGLVWMMRDERRDLPASAGTEYICRLGYFDGRNEVQTSYVVARSPGLSATSCIAASSASTLSARHSDCRLRGSANGITESRESTRVGAQSPDR